MRRIKKIDIILRTRENLYREKATLNYIFLTSKIVTPTEFYTAATIKLISSLVSTINHNCASKEVQRRSRHAITMERRVLGGAYR